MAVWLSQETLTNLSQTILTRNLLSKRFLNVSMSRLGKVLTFVFVLILSVSALTTINSSHVDAQTARSNFKEITINADGSINPQNVPITRSGSVYTLTDDIFGQITIDCDRITIDGSGHALMGLGNPLNSNPTVHTGIQTPDIKYNAINKDSITIKNLEIRGLDFGMNVALSNSAINNCKFIDCSGQLTLRGVNNTFSGNSIMGSGIGVVVWGSGHMIYNNYIANCNEAFMFMPLSEVTLKNNVIEDVYNPFYFYGNYHQDIDSSNVVDGLHVCYWLNQHDRTVPSDSGYVFLKNCARITVQGVSIINSSMKSGKHNPNGIYLEDTVDSVITNNQLMIGTGISVSASSTNITIFQNIIATNVIVSNCNITNNSIVKGGCLQVDNSIVASNRIDSCDYGIRIYNGKNNQILENNIVNCNISIYLHNTKNNVFSRNNFINNNQSVFETHEEYELPFGYFEGYVYSVNNTWDGNYWSDYKGSGVYVIFENYTDHNPLSQQVVISNTMEVTEISSFTIIVIVLALVISMSLVVYFKKRKHTLFKPVKP
jgi:parallel beta-helix repeat protein